MPDTKLSSVRYLGTTAQEALFRSGFFSGLQVDANGWQVDEIFKLEITVKGEKSTYAVGAMDYQNEGWFPDDILSSGFRPISEDYTLSDFELKSPLENPKWFRKLFNADMDLLEAVIYDVARDKAYFLKTLDMSDEQWDFASGESDYLGDTTLQSANDYANEFWKGSDYASGDHADTAIHRKYEALVPESYRVGDATADAIEAPELRDLEAAQNIARNLSFAMLNTWDAYVTSGYAFDEGYHNSVHGHPLHGGIDFSVGGETAAVRSPIQGHVIEISSKTSDLNSHIVIRELDGDRIWIIGHVDPRDSLEVGEYLAIGTPIGNLFPTRYAGGEVVHPAHLHVQTAENEVAKDLVPLEIRENGVWRGLTVVEKASYAEVGGDFPTNSLRFPDRANITGVVFDWTAESGWDDNIFGQDKSIEDILTESDSPLQAYFEENPFSAVEIAEFRTTNTGATSPSADENHLFETNLKEVGGGAAVGTDDQALDPVETGEILTAAGGGLDESALPNIRVTGQEWSGSSFAPYDLLRVDVDYTNDGSGDTGPINVALYMSLDETFTADEIVHQVRFEEGVFANGTHDVWFETYLPNVAGEYHMRVTIDASGEIVESNESDNHANTVISISSGVPVGSDQRIVSATLSESEIQAGDRPQLSVDIENTGAVGSGSTQLAYYRSTTTNFEDAVFLGNRSVNVEAGATHTETLSLPETWTNNLTQGQTYYFFVVANDEQAGSETDFSDNVSAAIALSIATQASQGEGADITSPSFIGASPESGATGVWAGVNLILNFDEAISYGTGLVSIRNGDNSVWRDIYTSDTTQIHFVGNQMVIDPAVDLEHGKSYHIFMSGDAVRDLAGNAALAITSSTALSFQTRTSGPIDEAGNTIGLATPIALNTVVSGIVGVDGDTDDYWQFTAPTYGMVTVELRGLYADVDLAIYDSNYAPLVGSAGDLNSDERVSFNVASGQTYFIHADPYGPAATSYFLETVFQAAFTGVTEGPDNIDGDNSANYMVGLGGNDTLFAKGDDDFLYGGDGDDKLFGGAGNDFIDGGEGIDRIGFSGTNPITVDLRITTAQDTGEGIDTIRNVESVFAGNGNDWLIGAEGAETLLGADGNDTLEGNGGNDVLQGDYGDDVLFGGAGDDWLSSGSGNGIVDGGEGNDIALFGVNLADAAIVFTDDVFSITSASATYSVTNVELFRFVTQSSDQTLDLAAMLAMSSNSAPVSTLPDTLSSNEGVISFDFAQYFTDSQGQALTWVFDGLPPGLSVAGMSTVTGTVQAISHPYTMTITVTDSFGASVTDTVDWTFENVNAAPTGGVGIMGTDTVGSLLVAQTGSLTDADGLGTLRYQWLRNDVAISGAESDRYQLNGLDSGQLINLRVSYTDGFGVAEQVTSPQLAVSAAALTLSGAASNDRLEGGVGSDSMSGGAGNDTLSGHDGGDSLYGGIGDDLLEGGSGADRLYGGAGSDTASYDTSTEAVIVDLSVGRATDGGVWGWMKQWYFTARAIGVGGDAEGDRFTSVENLMGSAFDDVLTGNHKANRLDGGAGNDTLTGGAGADVFVFRGGADVVTDFNLGTKFFGIKFWGPDRIEVDVEGVDSFADLMTHAVQRGGATVFEIDDDASLTLERVALSSISEEMFTFL